MLKNVFSLLPIYLRDAVLMYNGLGKKCKNGLAPDYLSSMFTLTSEVFSRSK